MITSRRDGSSKFAGANGARGGVHAAVTAGKQGRLGATTGHGYLTMSRCAPFLGQLCTVGGISMGINNGVDRARFITPVPAGGRGRGTGEILSAAEIPGGVQAVVKITIELEGAAKPAAVVETVTRYLA